MAEIEVLSIAEFAESAGVSKQAVYKQINNSNSQIAPYVVREGKKVLIRRAALMELYGVEIVSSTSSTATDDNQTTFTTQKEGEEVEKTTQQSTAEPKEEQPAASVSTTENQPLSTDYIEFLKSQVAELKAEKIEIEQRLNATIQEKDNIIKGQTEQLAQLAQQVASIANNAIITTSQQQYLTAMDKGEAAAEEQIVVNPKRGFFSKLFGK